MATQKKTTRGATRSPERQGLPASALLGTGFIAGIICSVLVYSTVISKHTEREAKLAESYRNRRATSGRQTRNRHQNR